MHDAKTNHDDYYATHHIINQPLVSQDRIILPPLHIKLGLMKQFVKALDKDRACFANLSKAFSGISSEKLKVGIFDDPQTNKSSYLFLESD